jgi:hypothetical protein
MFNKLSLLAAAALVAGGIGYALAQAPSPGGAANQGKCWDAVSKQIKDKTAMKDDESKPGSASPGAGTSGSGAAGTTAGSGAQGAKPGSAAGADRDRPPQAAGLPNC